MAGPSPPGGTSGAGGTGHLLLAPSPPSGTKESPRRRRPLGGRKGSGRWRVGRAVRGSATSHQSGRNHTGSRGAVGGSGADLTEGEGMSMGIEIGATDGEIEI